MPTDLLRTPFLACALLLFLAPFSPALPAAAPDEARQLISASGLESMLRTNAAQISRLEDQVSAEVPAELKPELRRAMDRNLSFDSTQASLIKAVAQLDAASVDRLVRWWSTPTGRAIAEAESGIYLAVHVPEVEARAYDNRSAEAEKSATIPDPRTFLNTLRALVRLNAGFCPESQRLDQCSLPELVLTRVPCKANPSPTLRSHVAIEEMLRLRERYRQ